MPKPRRKKNPARTKTAPGRKRKQPGHTSKSGKTALTSKRWVEVRTGLMKKAPKGMSPAQQLQWAEAEMKKKYRIKTLRKR